MENEELKPPVSNESTKVKPLDKELKFTFHFKKKLFLYIGIPALAIVLAILALWQQGFIGHVTKPTSLNVTVSDAKQQPIDQATVELAKLGDSSNLLAKTDINGLATINGNVSKRGEATTLTIKKAGFITYTLSIKIIPGNNNAPAVSLVEAPAEKIDFSAKIIDYITEQPIVDLAPTLGDVRGFFKTDSYVFSSVPIGSYKLTLARAGYNASTTNVEVSKDATALEPIQLVKAGRIVFESNRDGKRGIYSANYDGSDQKTLVARIGDYEDFSPILGPNQKKLFFTSTRDGVKDPATGDYKSFLYVVDADGKSLTKIGESSNSYSSKWSPDGGYIGFAQYVPSKGTHISTYNVTTKTLYPFAGYTASGDFAFSNDGLHLAFNGAAENDSSSRGVFYAESNGSNIIKIDSVESYSIEFTSTGTIRYSQYDTATSQTKFFEYNPSTQAKVEITAPAIDRVGAVLSPDKKSRAYVSTRDGKTNLYISDANGKSEKQLTTLNKVLPGDVLWSADSSFIMFNLHGESESARYLVSTNGKAKPKKIVDVNLSYNY